MPLPVAQILAAITTVIPIFKKKKKYCLWYRRLDGRWVKKTVVLMSKRQCKKTMKELIRTGADPERFSVLRDGTKPFDGISQP